MTTVPQAQPAGDGAASDLIGERHFVHLLNTTTPPGLKLMSAQVLCASRADRSVTVRYEFDERFNGIAGFICGGYIANALDQTMSAAVTFLSGKASPTLELKTSFINAFQPGGLNVTGRVIKLGKSIVFAEASAFDMMNRLVATASATAQIITMKRLKELGGLV